MNQSARKNLVETVEQSITSQSNISMTGHNESADLDASYKAD